MVGTDPAVHHALADSKAGFFIMLAAQTKFALA